MHATEREQSILKLLRSRDFVSFSELESSIEASPATIRRDLARLNVQGQIVRVRGGIKNAVVGDTSHEEGSKLSGVPFHRNINRMRDEKVQIGREAAKLCEPGSSIMIDGGSTTLQMCPFLQGLNMQVFTNSLHVVNALLPQAETRVLIPGGSVFREQSIILSAVGDDTMPRFHAPQLYMGASAIGAQGIMQPDVILVAAERRLIDRADQVILLIDHTKFRGSSGNVVCELEAIDIVITDQGVRPVDVEMLEKAGVQVIIAGAD